MRGLASGTISFTVWDANLPSMAAILASNSAFRESMISCFITSLGPLPLPPPLILISIDCFSPGCKISKTPGASCRLLGANGFGEYIPFPLWHKRALRSLFFEAYHFLVHLLLHWSKPHTFTSRVN